MPSLRNLAIAPLWLRLRASASARISPHGLGPGFFNGLLANALLAAVVVVPSAWRPPTVGAAECAGLFDRSGMKLVRAVGRGRAACMRGFATGALPPTMSVGACARSDFAGGACAAAEAGAHLRSCSAPPPPVLAAATAVTAGVAAELDALDAAVFGTEIDATQSDGWASYRRCRLRTHNAYRKLVGRRLRTFLTCKSEVVDPDSFACLDDVVDDAGGLIAARRNALRGVLERRCPAGGLAAAFPGRCAGAGDMTACLDALTACRTCRMLEAIDAFVGDCDRFDDGDLDGSCPSTPAGVCGDGVLDAGEHCDDGNATGGDCCPAACVFAAIGDDEDCSEPGCAQRCCAGAGTTCGGRDARAECGWMFVDVTAAAGIDYAHAYDPDVLDGPTRDRAIVAGGVAAGDCDGDGWIDLYAVGGPDGTNHLLRNRGDGGFEDVTAAAGATLPATFGSGPTFVDYDGDSRLDLIVGGVNGTVSRVLRNVGAGPGSFAFADVTLTTGLLVGADTFGSALGDYDGDGDLDLALAHWQQPIGTSSRLWRNEGDGTFTNATAAAGLAVGRESGWLPFLDWSFTPNFADIDDDGRPDLLLAADFGNSQVFMNDGDGTFTDATDDAVVTDENGMGASVADYDADGDLDWFVSSIWDPSGEVEGNWGASGNRLYRNRGDGTFEDATAESGLRRGYWGWASCFADFDLDGSVDLFHTNGFSTDSATEFYEDPSRLFIAGGDGTFVERSAELGLSDTDQGRGVVCFDYDGDGDVDIFVANNDGSPTLWANRAEVLGRHFVQIALRAPAPNTQGIGARVSVTVGAHTQMRELRAGSNFESQDPAVAHFGIGAAAVVDTLRIDWPSGAVQTFADFEADRFVTIEHPHLDDD